MIDIIYIIILNACYYFEGPQHYNKHLRQEYVM